MCPERNNIEMYQKARKPIHVLRYEQSIVAFLVHPIDTSSVGIDLKELGDQISKCVKFCTGIEILNRFSLKNERL